MSPFIFSIVIVTSLLSVSSAQAMQQPGGVGMSPAEYEAQAEIAAKAGTKAVAPQTTTKTVTRQGAQPPPATHEVNVVTGEKTLPYTPPAKKKPMTEIEKELAEEQQRLANLQKASRGMQKAPALPANK